MDKLTIGLILILLLELLAIIHGQQLSNEAKKALAMARELEIGNLHDDINKGLREINALTSENELLKIKIDILKAEVKALDSDMAKAHDEIIKGSVNLRKWFDKWTQSDKKDELANQNVTGWHNHVENHYKEAKNLLMKWQALRGKLEMVKEYDKSRDDTFFDMGDKAKIHYLFHALDHNLLVNTRQYEDDIKMIHAHNQPPEISDVSLPKNVKDLLSTGRLTCTNETMAFDKVVTGCQEIEKFHDGFLTYITFNRDPTRPTDHDHQLMVSAGCDKLDNKWKMDYDKDLYKRSNKDDYDIIKLCGTGAQGTGNRCESFVTMTRAGWNCNIRIPAVYLKRRDRQCRVSTKKTAGDEFEITIKAPGKEQLLYRLGHNEFHTTFEKEIKLKANIKDPKIDFHYKCGPELDYKSIESRGDDICRKKTHYLYAWTCNRTITTIVSLVLADLALFILFQFSMIRYLTIQLLGGLLFGVIWMRIRNWTDEDCFAYLTAQKDKKRCPFCDAPVNNFMNHWRVAHNESETNDIKMNCRQYMKKHWGEKILGWILAIAYIILTGLILYFLIDIPVAKAEHADILENIQGLYNFTGTRHIDGYHTYKVQNFIDKNRVDTIDTVIDSRKCKGGMCTGTVKADMTVKLLPGFTSGFKMKVEGSEYIIGIRSTTTKGIYQAEYLYDDCENEIINSSGDTCTLGCEDCQKALGGSGLEINLPETSNWGCNYWSCWAVDQGCTCSKCTHKQQGDCYSVYKLHKVNSLVEICIEIGNLGQCFEVNEKDPAIGKLFKMIFLSPPNLDDGLLVAQHLHSLYRGPINDLGEADNKFGALQFLTENITNCYSDLDYEHHCVFGHHRWITINKCCKDTHYLKKDLIPLNHIHLATTNEKSDLANVFIHEEVDLGTARIVLNLPEFPLYDIEHDVKLSNISLSGFGGCPVCKEGATAKLGFDAEGGGWADIKSNMILAQSKIMIRKGYNEVPILFKSWKPRGNLTLNINDLIITHTFNLTDERKGLLDRTHHKDNLSDKGQLDCGTLACMLQLNWMGWFWSPFGFGMIIASILLIMVFLSLFIK